MHPGTAEGILGKNCLPVRYDPDSGINSAYITLLEYRFESGTLTFPDDLTDFHREKYTSIQANNSVRKMGHRNVPISSIPGVICRRLWLKHGSGIC